MDRQAQLEQAVLDCGAAKVASTEVEKIPFRREFRAACEVNTCGNFNKCWTCPPCVGDIDELMERAKGYRHALVYQTIASLEDSFDIEGMLEAGARHNQLAQKLAETVIAQMPEETLHLSAGGCRVCEVCAKREEQPCRFPELALASLEAYGVLVSELAEQCGLKYINGQNTVTYFGAILYM